MEPRVIKTEDEHKATLAEVERLAARDPRPNTAEADRLELLAALVEDYEKERFPIEKPTPIEAISFRMEEQGLKQKDLVPYIGSKSKVSEVLSGRRKLTLPMIRALHHGLGIPLQVLTQEPDDTEAELADIEWDRFPIREMVKRGWLAATIHEIRSNAKQLMERFFASLGDQNTAIVFCRRTKFRERSRRKMDKYALLAWTARVLILAQRHSPATKYEQGVVTDNFLKKVAQLSALDGGPLLAQEFLSKHGIPLIIEPHLPRTYLDGAAILTENGMPVIGLTIRHDRLDNFWHTLLHELAHVLCHLRDPEESFVDDLEVKESNDPREREADLIARNSFIPREQWRRESAYYEQTEEAIINLANKLHIHAAIVAGRIHYETQNYYKFTHLVGRGQVRRLFSNAKWK